MADIDKPLTARLGSLEFLGSAVFTAFLVGGSWFSTTLKVSAQDEAIKSVQVEQKEISDKVHQIKTDVAVILERQKSADERAERNEKTTQRILDLLQKRERDDR